MKKFLINILAILNAKEKHRFGILVILDVLISMLDIAFLAFLIFVIHFYTKPDTTGQFSFLPQWLFNNNSLLLISLFFLLFSIKNFIGFLIHRAQSRFICRVATRLSEHQLKEYLHGKYENYVAVDSAVHIRRISHQPIDFSQHILGGIQQIITQSVLIVLTITIMILFNAKIFFFLFMLLLPPVIIVFYLIKTKLKSVRKYSQVSIEKSWQHLREALSGFVESNIYKKNDFFLRRYIIHQGDFNRRVSDMLIVQGIPNRMIEIFALLGLFFLIAINQSAGVADSSAIVTVGAFMAAAYKIIPGIVKILNTSGQINNYSYTVNELVRDNNESPLKSPDPLPGMIQTIRLTDVSFHYNGSALLENLNIEIRPGDFLGISGRSGSGKTTILNLLLGFLKPCGGEISFNGRALDPDKIQDYWQFISYVKQQPFLIHDTLVHNIILDNPPNQEKLHEVIHIAGLNEFLDMHSQSHGKIIMESGKNISGGQRQRIAIARALYKDADVVILDEPFNELDESTELGLLAYFQKLSKQGKIIVLITHNKASFSYCNKTISLDGK